MRVSIALSIGALVAAMGLYVQGQNAPGKAEPFAAKGMPPRSTPADYLSHAQAGTVTVAAEFAGHSLPTLEGSTLSSEDYVAVEAGLFGPPGTRTNISIGDFALRINGRKAPYPAVPYGLVAAHAKDPEWEPPEKIEERKTKMTGGSDTGGSSIDKTGEPKATPTPIKIPLAIQRGWAQRVQKVTLPEGDRALPQAGLLFFEFHGKREKILSLELLYTGPAGKATVPLQP
jgi:hypothetical protein